MLKRAFTAAVLVGVLVGLLFLRELDPLWFDLAIVLAMLISVAELIRAFREQMTLPAIVVLLLFVAYVYPAYRFLGGLSTVLISAVAAFAVLNVVLLFDAEAQLTSATHFLFMLFYPVLILATFFEVNRHAAGGLVGLVTILAVSSLTDTFALFAGKLVGGKKLCPSISPNKTVAGAVGGVFGGVGGALAVWGIFRASADAVFSFPGFPAWAVFLTLGFLGAILTQLGDLVASGIKRRTGLKDFGNIFPGHGGILDRMDGILYNGLMIYGFFAIFL